MTYASVTAPRGCHDDKLGFRFKFTAIITNGDPVMLIAVQGLVMLLGLTVAPAVMNRSSGHMADSKNDDPIDASCD